MIKTFMSNGDKWNMITQSAANNVTVDASFSTWDPTAIDWSQITQTPANINIFPTSGTTLPQYPGAYPGDIYIGDPMPYTDPLNPFTNVGGNSQFIGCGPQDYNWFNSFVDQYAFTKPAGVRPDVLMGFFSKYVHALLFVTDQQSYVIPFMERVGAIWLQKGPNKWVAYDKKEFYAFIDNPDVMTFNGTELNKREIQKTLADAKPEDDE